MPRHNNRNTIPPKGDPPSLETHNNSLLAEIREIGAATDKAADRFIYFFERLLLLDGGTLTLTFTMIAALHSVKERPLSVQHIAYLSWAWRLLFISMVSSLYTQLMGAKVSLSNAIFLRAKIMTVSLERLKRALSQPPETLPAFVALEAQLSELDVSKSRKIQARITTVTAYAALLSTVLAFLLLILFAQANLGILIG